MTVPSIMVERFKLHFLGACLLSYFCFFHQPRSGNQKAQVTEEQNVIIKLNINDLQLLLSIHRIYQSSNITYKRSKGYRRRPEMEKVLRTLGPNTYGTLGSDIESTV